MTDPLDGFAQHLRDAGLVEYDPVGVTGTCFIESMPAAPDTAVVLSLYGGPQPDSRLGYDTSNLQVRVRGTTDPRVSRTLATAIYSELQGLGPIVLPDGTDLQFCNAIQTVTLMGQDAQRRYEHVCNYALGYRSITAHRV